MDLAIVGLPLSGKTATFRALTAGHAQAGDARREHVGVVKLPDERLERLATLVQAKKVTHAELRLHDLPPLFGEGVARPPPEAADSLAAADGLLFVVRAFRREDVPHPQGSVDPGRDIESFQGELLRHDLAIVERRLEKLDISVRSARPGERDAGEREQRLLQRLHQQLEGGVPLRDQSLTPEDEKALSGYGFLTSKPLLVLLNINEADVGSAAEIEAEYASRYRAGRTLVAAFCARLEAELAELPPEEAAEFRRELGAGDSALQRLLRLAQELLGLVTFYTPVGDECRAWPVPAGSTALQAAGRIHSDMERGFIRAEVIAWERLMEFGSLAEAKKHGLLRAEGKQYAVQDGDVVHILFHV